MSENRDLEPNHAPFPPECEAATAPEPGTEDVDEPGSLARTEHPGCADVFPPLTSQPSAPIPGEPATAAVQTEVVDQFPEDIRGKLGDLEARLGEVEHRLLGQFADFDASLRAIARSSDAQAASATTRGNGERDMAIRALVAVDRQLERLVQAIPDRVDVLEGQRSNLRSVLAVWGVTPISPRHGDLVDPREHRTSAATIDTGHSELSGRVGETMQSGWRDSSGRVLELAEVVPLKYLRPPKMQTDSDEGLADAPVHGAEMAGDSDTNG